MYETLLGTPGLMVGDLACVGTLMQLAAESPSREVCGVILAGGMHYPLVNTSRDPDRFIVSRVEWGKLKNSRAPLYAIYHSHRSGEAIPSAEDLASYKNYKLHMVVVTPTKWSLTLYE